MKIPCEECISFAICKQKLKAMTNPEYDVTKFSISIENECEELRTYTKTCSIRQINKARLLYGLCKVHERRVC